MSQESPIDTDTYSMLHELMGDEEFNEIVDFFRTDTQRALDNIKTSISNNNAEMVSTVCHKLKSSCRLIGANQLAALADTLEKQKDELNDDAPVLGQHMQEQFNAIIAWLDSESITV